MKTLLLFVAIALSINVFGQDIKTVKIGNLEVMTEDLGEMNWDEAKKACENLGDGWRLPTKDELNMMYENQDKIGGFVPFSYWSSTEGVDSRAWSHQFDGGDQYLDGKLANSEVRAVRDF